MRTTLWLGTLLALLMMADRRPAAAQPGSFEVTLNLARTAIQPGEALAFTIRVRNLTGAQITLNFSSSLQYDLVLRSESGEIGRLSADRAATLGLTQRRWQPGETVVYTDSWVPRSTLLPTALSSAANQVLAADVYTVFAELTTLDIRPASRPRTVIVGAAMGLPQGCTLLPRPFPASLPASLVAETVEPSLALRAIWRYSPATNRYALYTPDLRVPADLTQINAGDRLLICMNAPGLIITPAG